MSVSQRNFFCYYYCFYHFLLLFALQSSKSATAVAARDAVDAGLARCPGEKFQKQHLLEQLPEPIRKIAYSHRTPAGKLLQLQHSFSGIESFQSLIEQLAKLCGHVEIPLYQESTLHPVAPLDEQFSQFLEYQTLYRLQLIYLG